MTFQTFNSLSLYRHKLHNASIISSYLNPTKFSHNCVSKLTLLVSRRQRRRLSYQRLPVKKRFHARQRFLSSHIKSASQSQINDDDDDDPVFEVRTTFGAPPTQTLTFYVRSPGPRSSRRFMASTRYIFRKVEDDNGVMWKVGQSLW